ncbi:MAG: hypothetical protein AB7O04_08175 [Hyphomonadaceae bacterium]
MWILRWPLVLALFALTLICLAAAAGTAADRAGFALQDPLWQSFAAQSQGANWVQTGLLAGGALFLFIGAVRLIRRTQAFWAWLIGFGLLGVRWGLMRQSEGGLQFEAAQFASVQGAQKAAADAANDYGLLALGVLFALGLLILIVDAADRAYWTRREG